MELSHATALRLVNSARTVQSNAYAPYSHFPVGAAVLAEDGRVFEGCNVENSSFGLTICAERNAVAAAVAAAARPVAVAVATTGDFVPPCGACRQVLAEFDPAMPVILVSADGQKTRLASLADLLPESFHLG